MGWGQVYRQGPEAGLGKLRKGLRGAQGVQGKMALIKSTRCGLR